MSLLQTRHLTVERGGTAIVDDINLDIQAGELVMLVGPNGAGKSTLLQRLAGVQPLSRGSIHLPLSGAIRIGPGYWPFCHS